MIKFRVCPIDELTIEVSKILMDEFDFYLEEHRLNRFVNQFKDSIYILLEYPYVDKLHRDSYYFHYSSKRYNYLRNTIRLTLFDGEISENDFKCFNNHDKLQKKFRGFIVIRPVRKIIGRNIISPLAFKTTDFYIRTIKTNVTICGMKLVVKGFPHSSQDNETITCAETSIWAIMEYFGTRYSEYKTILPSKIRKILNPNMNQRLVPSEGLNVEQMSYLFQQFGFGSKIYYRDNTKLDKGQSNHSFDYEHYPIINCYLESGIPIIIGLYKYNSSQGHVVIGIGRKHITESALQKVPAQKINNALIVDFNSADREIIVIDDNHPVYRAAPISKPTSYYRNQKKWKGFIIDSVVVPHHKKIFMDAIEAKAYLIEFLGMNDFISLSNEETNIYRLFLTSSRSLKFNLLKNKSLNNKIREYILRLELPKFVWITELTTFDLIKNNEAQGLILFDATEKQSKTLLPLIFSYYKGSFFQPNYKDPLNFKKILVPLKPFKMFKDNLNGY